MSILWDKTYILRLFNSLYSYYRIPLQLKKGRVLLAETRSTSSGFTYNKNLSGNLYSIDAGNMNISLSSYGEAFVDITIEKEQLRISSCKCQLTDVTPIYFKPNNYSHFAPACTMAEFIAFCTVLYNYFSDVYNDELPAYLSAHINSIFNSSDLHIHQAGNEGGEEFIELSNFEEMSKYDRRKLEYIRNGDTNGLIKWLSSDRHRRIDIAYYKTIQEIVRSIDYTLPTLHRIVGEVSGDTLKSWTTYHKYKNAETAITDIPTGIKLYHNMLIEFCDIVSRATKGLYSPKIQEIRLYLNANWNKDINIALLCRNFDISRSYLMKLFKKEVGRTIWEYITDTRIDYIKHMLIYTKEPVSQISAEAGYNNQSYMASVFKRKTGMTPLEYQKKYFTLEKDKRRSD